MNTNKVFLLAAACLLSGAFCALSAMASTPRPDAYKQLTAVEKAPAHAPSISDGPYRLSHNERRFAERLPLQLEGPIKKIKGTKYEPASKRKPAKPVRKQKAPRT